MEGELTLNLAELSIDRAGCGIRYRCTMAQYSNCGRIICD